MQASRTNTAARNSAECIGYRIYNHIITKNRNEIYSKKSESSECIRNSNDVVTYTECSLFVNILYTKPLYAKGPWEGRVCVVAYQFIILNNGCPHVIMSYLTQSLEARVQGGRQAAQAAQDATYGSNPASVPRGIGFLFE